MGIKRDVLNKIAELKEISGKGLLKQEEIASYMGMTRQSISKIFKGELIGTSKQNEERLSILLEGNEIDLNRAGKVVKLHGIINKVINDAGQLTTSEIENYIEIQKYIKYWNDEKNKGESYMEKINFHLQNFHMRTNPYYLFFKEFFHKDLSPVLTFEIDYNNDLIKSVTLGNIESFDYLDRDYDLAYQRNWDQKFTKKPMGFEKFIDSLLSFYEGKLNIYILIISIINLNT